MNLKEARKLTRGMCTRIETVYVYNVTVYYTDKKQVGSIQITERSENLAKKYVLKESNCMIVDIEPIKTQKIMYAMDRDKFRDSASKIIELED